MEHDCVVISVQYNRLAQQHSLERGKAAMHSYCR